MMKSRNVAFSLLTIVFISCGAGANRKIVELNLNENPMDLSALDFWNEYAISDKRYGTMTTVEIRDGKRIMKTNALPNHPTGDFPNEGNPNRLSAQDLEYSFPIQPEFLGEPRWAREPGIALNGIKFEPETAERFICETGEEYRIEAFQDLLDMGLDFNHAHVQPTGAYHYHGVPTGLIEGLNDKSDNILVGFAHDGFPIYYSRSGKYKPGFQLREEPRTGDVCTYNNPKTRIEKELNGSQPDGTFVSDWVYVEGLGNLDECNGTMIDGSYAYFVTDEYPYMGRCLKGAFAEQRRPGPPPGGHSHRPGLPPHQH